MQVLITITKGIIDEVIFFDDPGMAVWALSKYVRNMNPEHDDAAVYGDGALIANAKHFLDENDHYVENTDLLSDIREETHKPIYIIGNPEHHLGFMVASPDDPLGYADPVEAVAELGQMRKDFGRHLKLFRVVPVTGPVAQETHVEAHNADCEVQDFDYGLVEEYLIKT
jgi:hypothetical protein